MSNTTRTHALPALVAFALALAGTFSVSSALADPPTRVARLSNIDGTVTFSPAGDDQWVQAILNRPVITGDRLWSDNGGRVELSLDNGALWLGSMTSLVASNIDDRTTQLELQQGTLEFRVRRMTPGSTIEIDTPNLAFQVTHPGRYRLDVDPQSGSTTVEVRAGGAEVYGERASYALASGQGYRFYGTDLNDSEYFAPPNADEFDRYAGERDARFDSVASARYVSPEVVGYEDLDRYGSWNSVSSYGNVWFPRQVASEWAPYRDGHWSWIDPWGWTWVDDAPWGFAPFHYGRWAYVSNRWGWIPGPVNVRPVYAPALVAFVGGAGFSISVSSGPAIGWIPLGPREVYRPAYNVSRDYYRQVNVSNTVINNTVINNTYVTNVTNTTAPVQQANFVNLRAPNAVTAVSHATFSQSQPVNRALVRIPNAAVNSAQVQAVAPVAPARAAFVGAAPLARARPPAAIEQRPVVARAKLPPSPIPVAQQMPLLERNPGKPLDRAELQAKGGPAPAPARNVKMVNAVKPSSSAPPPAVRGDATRARGAPAPVPANPATPNPAPQAQPPMQRPPEQRAAPPEAQRGAPQVQPAPQPRPPEQRAAPQEPPRPAPQAPAPQPRPAEQRAAPQEPPRPAPQARAPQPRPPEQRAAPQEPPRPAPQAPAPQQRPPEQRPAPQQQPTRPAPQAPPQARLPEQRAAPQEPPHAVPQPQPQARPQPAPPPGSMQRGVPQPQPAPKPDDKSKGKDKEKDKDKQG